MDRTDQSLYDALESEGGERYLDTLMSRIVVPKIPPAAQRFVRTAMLDNAGAFIRRLVRHWLQSEHPNLLVRASIARLGPVASAKLLQILARFSRTLGQVTLVDMEDTEELSGTAGVVLSQVPILGRLRRVLGEIATAFHDEMDDQGASDFPKDF
jgi:hypothetical protein